jgi:hypothetical protein
MEAGNFRDFKIVTEGSLAPFTTRGRPVEAIGDHAWVQQAWVTEQSGFSDSPDWLAGFEAMVAFAKSKGWVRAADGAIRAHIEYRAA